MLRLLMLALLFCLDGAAAQAPARKKTAAPRKTAAVPDKWPIESIVVTGNKIFTAEQVASAAGLKVSQVAGKTDFDAARDRLIATGMFETIGYKFGPAPHSSGYAATFEVVEVTPMFPVRFEGLSAPASELDATLRSKDLFYRGQLPGSATVLDSYARQIESYLASRNHPEKVVGKVVATGPNQFQIVFRSATAFPAIAEITFEGNEIVPTAALQHAISEVAFGVPFSEDGFRQLLDTQVRPVYDARGRIAVSFPKITTEPSTKVKGVIVHVTVKEGPSYELGKVVISGAPGGENSDLIKVANIKTGDIANFDDVNQGVERLKKSLQRNGYLHAEAVVQRKMDDQAKKVDVAIELRPGTQFQFGKLTIQGLDLNSEPAVRKLWGVKEGKPFNAEYPNYFLNRIREDGLFDNLGETKAFTEVNEQNHTADVTLRFAGAPPAPNERRRKTN